LRILHGQIDIFDNSNTYSYTSNQEKLGNNTDST